MGRSHKRKRNSHAHDDQGRFNKRRRSNNSGQTKERFWIIDCEDSEEAIDGKSFDIELLVTRCELLDDCRQVCTNDTDVTVNHESLGIDMAESKGDTPTADGESIKQAIETDPTEAEKQPHILSIGITIDEANVEQEVAGSHDAEAETITEDERTDPTEANDPPQRRSDDIPIAEANVGQEVAGNHNADDESIKESGKTHPNNADDAPNRLPIATPIAEANIEQEVAASPVQTTTDESNMPTVGIKKSRKAKSPFPKCRYDPELPNGDCGDGIINPFPKDEVPDKFWAQRRRLFTRFDQGIQLDRESWYSVTPEVIASHISKRLVGNGKDVVVLDPFCGCGGNSIAFASRPEVKTVVCVDLDLEKLKKAYHNASIYGVEKKLLLVLGNAFAVLSRYNGGKRIESNDTASLPNFIDVVFLSPPWGGIDYNKVGKHGYDLTCIKIDVGNGEHRDGEFLLQRVAAASGHKAVGYFLPRNINGISFARSALKAGFTGPVVLEQNIVNGKLKTVTSYLGLGSE